MVQSIAEREKLCSISELSASFVIKTNQTTPPSQSKGVTITSARNPAKFHNPKKGGQAGSTSVVDGK